MSEREYSEFQFHSDFVGMFKRLYFVIEFTCELKCNIVYLFRVIKYSIKLRQPNLSSWFTPTYLVDALMSLVILAALTERNCYHISFNPQPQYSHDLKNDLLRN